MSKFYFVLVFLITLNLFAQNKFDKILFEKKRKEIERIANFNIDTAATLADELMELAVKSKSREYLAKSEATLALVAIYKTDFDTAEKLNHNSITINKALKNEAELANNYFNNALIFQRKSDYVNTVKYFFKTIDLAEKTKNFILVQKSYHGLAMSYCDQNDFDKALVYGFKGLKTKQIDKNITEKAYLIAAIGEVYRLKNELILANKYFENAFNLFVKIKNEHGKAWVLTNWSLCFEDNLSKLIDMELEAQEIWDKIAPENMMSITNLGNIAYTYFDFAKSDGLIAQIKNPKIPKVKEELLKSAEEYYSKCLSVAKKKNNLNSLLYYSGSLSELQAYRGNYRMAYENLKLRNKLNDSIYSQKNKNKIAALESAKELELRDKQIQYNKLKLATKEKQKYFFISGLVLLGIIGGLLYYQSRNRKKTNEKLQLLNSELDQANKAKTRFFSILNHDLRAPVANLVNFLQLQSENPDLLDEETAKQMHNKTIIGAENLLNSMEDILQWSKSQMENFKPQPKQVFISRVFDDIKTHFSSFEMIELLFENQDNIVLVTDENYLKTIIRNLTANAIKATENIENPKIILKAWQENNQSFISITDNGKGADLEQFKALYDETEVTGIKSGLGLHLIRDMAKAISCSVSLDKKIQNGTSLVLIFTK